MSDDTHTEQTAIENLGRMAARGFVIAGGAFWMVAAFSGPYVFHDTSLMEALGTAFWPFLATVLTLVIGWTYERLAAVLLFAGSAAVFVWGILYQWEIGVWILMAFVLFAPMLIAGVAFLLAAHAERRRNSPPEPRPTTTKSSTRTSVMPRRSKALRRPYGTAVDSAAPRRTASDV